MYQTTPSLVTERNPRVSAICPECGIDIHFTHPPALQEVIYCMECDTNLEVVQRYPLKLDWFFETPFESDEFDDDAYYAPAVVGVAPNGSSWDDFWE